MVAHRLLLICCLGAGACLVGAPASLRADEKEGVPAVLAPREWLVIGPVDRRARRPFNPDAVFERYLLDPRSGVPYEGDTLTGERGEEQAWRRVVPDPKGFVGGRMAYAYARLESPEAQVRIARLQGGGRLYVNGVPTVGDIYAGGFGGFPVALEKGVNHLFVRGVRGSFKLTLEEPPAPVFLAPWSRTLPDLVAGETVDTQAGVLLVNATADPLPQALVTLEGSGLLEPAAAPRLADVPPLGVVQVRLPLRSRPGKTVPADVTTHDVALRIALVHQAPIAAGDLALPVRQPTDALLRTFVSAIDDSVQVYGLRRPAPSEEPPAAMGLVLTLHGAGVRPRGQAKAYAAKPDFWIVAPTNRRRFGFDWQDWGRQDAYEVLADALAVSGVDRHRVYLTGHSMGGHGAWHLAANDPDGFAALAPSAGWVSFDSYGGARPPGALAHLWRGADAASDTLALVPNLAQMPTYILHGEKDDNVPLSEARLMEKVLTSAGARFAMHVEPGKGHWWDGYPEPGAQCVDWPAIFALFREHEIPRRPIHLHFKGVHPGVDARHHWIEVLQPERYGEPFEVDARYDPQANRVAIDTKNVRTLALKRPGDPFDGIVLDGRPCAVPGADGVLRRAGSWRHAELLPAPGGEKTPSSCGPFKRAFDRGFVFVYGTRGAPAENSALWRRARFDAQMWCYRANGQTRLLPDTLYLHLRKQQLLAQRNVILYGNADTNAAFSILGKRCPLKASRGGVRLLGGGSWVGEDLAACFVYPQEGGDGALVGVFADTGVSGTRLGYTHMAFVSGAGYPDYVVYDPRVLTQGDGGVLAAGWFDNGWRLQEGGYRKEASALKPMAPAK